MPTNVDFTNRSIGQNIGYVNTNVKSIMAFIETMVDIVINEARSKLATWLEVELINFELKIVVDNWLAQVSK